MPRKVAPKKDAEICSRWRGDPPSLFQPPRLVLWQILTFSVPLNMILKLIFLIKKPFFSSFKKKLCTVGKSVKQHYNIVLSSALGASNVDSACPSLRRVRQLPNPPSGRGPQTFRKEPGSRGKKKGLRWNYKNLAHPFNKKNKNFDKSGYTLILNKIIVQK